MSKIGDIPRIGILIGTTFHWGRNIIDGILSYSHANGPWHIRLQPRDPVAGLEKMLKNGRIDGIIASVNTPELSERLQQLSIPVVNVADEDIGGFSAPSVRTDDTVSTRMAAEHFVDRGFRNIAFAAWMHRSNPQRYLGDFKAALDRYDLSCHVFREGLGQTVDIHSLREWIVSLPKPVGLLTWGVGIAYQAVDSCLEMGIEVPHDVAVLSGGDDDIQSRACYPTLSGIKLPTEQIGYRAAELMDRMLAGENIPHEPIYLRSLGVSTRLSTDTLAVEDPQMVQVIRFLRDNACGPIAMGDVLAKVPMSKSTLERRFKQAFGRTPFDEVKRIRVNHARKLLAETDMPIPQVAESCGFATYNYLSRVFKSETGYSPGGFRKANRNR